MLAKAAVSVLLCTSMLAVAQPGAASDPVPMVPNRGGGNQSEPRPFPPIPPKYPPREPDGRQPPTDDGLKRVVVAQKPRFEGLAGEDLRDLKISVSESATLASVVQAIGAAAHTVAHADWARLGSDNRLPDRLIGAPLQSVRIEDALVILHSRGLTGPEPMAARRTGETIEVSSLRVFDRREQTTRAYDLRALLPADPMQRELRLRNILNVITTTIEPDGWADNGGDTSRLSELDGRLFVVAPPRVQAGVSWVLAQVGGREVEDAQR